MRRRIHFSLFAGLALVASCLAQDGAVAGPRVVELTADKDSVYRMQGKASPKVEVLPGEHLILRVTAVRAKQIARDGSVHGLTLLDKNLDAVPGWRFYLRPGVQDLDVVAPLQPGRYTAVCTIICSDAHDGMKFTLVVEDPKETARSRP